MGYFNIDEENSTQLICRKNIFFFHEVVLLLNLVEGGFGRARLVIFPRHPNPIKYQPENVIVSVCFHQTCQVPKMEVLTYISCMYSLCKGKGSVPPF